MDWQDCAAAIWAFRDVSQIAEICHQGEPRGFGGYHPRMKLNSL